MLLGVFFGVVACMIWGCVYIAPLLLPNYDPAVLATCRYVVFGALSVGLGVAQLKDLRHYKWNDWWQAILLGVVGNIFYYWLLSEAVQHAGAPIAGAFTAMIPILVAIIGNYQEKDRGNRVPWKALILPLTLIAIGMACLNGTEFLYLVGSGRVTSTEFWVGVVFAAGSLVVWTWYPLKNAAWLIKNPERSPKAWSSAQGIALFPASLVLLAFFWYTTPAETGGLLGQDPTKFLLICLFLGTVCSWLGIFFWNLMSLRLPPALGGQMIIFETIFAVVYAHIWRGQWPSLLMTVGMTILLVGIAFAMRVFQRAREAAKAEAAKEKALAAAPQPLGNADDPMAPGTVSPAAALDAMHQKHHPSSNMS